MADDISINEKTDILDRNLDANDKSDEMTGTSDYSGSDEAAPAASDKEGGNVSNTTENAGKTSGSDAAPTPKHEPENLVVEGFEFLSKEDADKAKLDKQKIAILGKKVKSTKVADLEAVYEKAISNKIFSTPVGWFYLARLRDKLYQAGVREEDLPPIPIEFKITRVNLKDEYHPRQYITPVKPKRDKKTTMFLLGAMNVILVILIVVLFLIAYYSETDNIINYKQNVTNRYAQWEQSLKEREKAVRIMERDLMIEDDTGYAEEFGVDLDSSDESDGK